MNLNHSFVVLDQSLRGLSVPLLSFATYASAKAFVLGTSHNAWLCIYPMRQAIAEGLVK